VSLPIPTWLLAFAHGQFQLPSSQQQQAVQGPDPGGVTAVAPDNSELPVMDGATLQCSCGLAPGRLNVLPASRPGNVNDAVPVTNIMSFGMCCSMANPAVAAASAAALGVLTPMPCLPITVKWDNGSSTQLSDGEDALKPASTVRCTWSGTVSIVSSSY
jgi:hypothetical protein